MLFAEVVAQLGIEPMTTRCLVVALSTKLLGRNREFPLWLALALALHRALRRMAGRLVFLWVYGRWRVLAKGAAWAGLL